MVRKKLWALYFLPVLMVSCGKLLRYQEPKKRTAQSVGRAADCEAGHNAFKTTFYQHLRKDCLPCHAEGGLADIPHSSNDSRKSYFRILGYTNFSNLEKSLIVTKGGNRHCLKYEGSCVSTEKDIKEQIQKWWEEGQKNCPLEISLVTKPVEISETTPETELDFDLGHLGSDYQGLSWSVKLKRSEAFLALSHPRIKGAKRGFRISGISIYLDGKELPEMNNWQMINARVNPGPQSALLSSFSLFFDLRNRTFGEISFGFKTLAPSPRVQCENMSQFENAILPVLAKRACLRCHQGGNADDSVGIAAKKAMFLSNNLTEQCAELLLRGWGEFVGDTPLISLPFRGALAHPTMFPTTGSELNLLKSWAESEIANKPLITNEASTRMKFK